MRRKTAAAAPQNTACFCCFSGRERAARAITTALSPERMMLTQMIAPSPSQNCEVITSCIQSLPLAKAVQPGSEQADDLPVDEVDLHRRGHLGQPGHGHDVAADHH